MYEDEKRAYEKMLNSLTSLGNCKLKQGATTTHLWEWPPSKSLTAPSPGEDVREQELTLTTGNDAKWHRPLEDWQLDPWEAKHRLPTSSGNCTKHFSK